MLQILFLCFYPFYTLVIIVLGIADLLYLLRRFLCFVNDLRHHLRHLFGHLIGVCRGNGVKQRTRHLCSKVLQSGGSLLLYAQFGNGGFRSVLRAVFGVLHLISAVVGIEITRFESRMSAQVCSGNRHAQNASEGLCSERIGLDFAVHDQNMCARTIPTGSGCVFEEHIFHRIIAVGDKLYILFLVIKPFGDVICRHTFLKQIIAHYLLFAFDA